MADVGADHYRAEAQGKFNTFKHWVQTNSPSRYTFSYKTDPAAAPSTGKANSWNDLRTQLSAARTRPFQMINVTAWNDKAGTYSSVTHSKEFEVNVIVDALLQTFI